MHNLTYKIIISPDNEITNDLGTLYLTTEDKEFMDQLEKIDNHLVMVNFLDNNTDKYKELIKSTDNYDKLIDLSDGFTKLVENEKLTLLEKLELFEKYHER